VELSTKESPPEQVDSIIERLLLGPEYPKVLLAISLQGERWQTCEEAFADWIRDVPLLAKSLTLEAVFKSFSTIMMVAMPIALWDLLPEHPACSFLGFTKSSNLLLHTRTSYGLDWESQIYTRPENLGG